MKRPDIKLILELLVKQYGHRSFTPHHDPVAELVRTILSQNTSDANSRPAFTALMDAFRSWENIMQADTDAIAGVIKSGGLGRIKAERIQQALQEIVKKQGKLDLGFLENLPVPEARERLKELPGVGNKTANCVLLFALGKPALPVDTHIYRLSGRLRLIRQKASLDESHRLLELQVPPENIYEFHVLMIEHGRHVCLARRPRCLQCILQHICPGYRKFTGHVPGEWQRIISGRE
jgi:endonuclease III